LAGRRFLPRRQFFGGGKHIVVDVEGRAHR
jgi:hypothetical protein